MGMMAAGQGSQSSLQLVSCSTLLLLPTRGLLASNTDLPGARLANADGALSASTGQGGVPSSGAFCSELLCSVAQQHLLESSP